MFGYGLLLSETDVYDEYGSNNLCRLTEAGRTRAQVHQQRVGYAASWEMFAYVIKNNDFTDKSFPISDLSNFWESREVDPEATLLSTGRVFLYSRDKSNVMMDKKCTLAIEVLNGTQLIFIPAKYLERVE